MSDIVGPGGRCVALEPNPVVFETLAARVGGHPSVVLLNAAVSDRPRRATLFVDTRPEMHGQASSLEDLAGFEEKEPIEVDRVTIDEVCARDGLRPNLLKVDVEGHEPQVFAGARSTLERFRPVIVFEFWETWWTRGYRELFRELTPHYSLEILQTGEPCEDIYEREQRSGVVDIVGTPRNRGRPRLRRLQAIFSRR